MVSWLFATVSVYKKLEDPYDPQAASCAAQMFLDSGDGVVFKGAIGPWYSPEGWGQFHLSQKAAKELMSLVLKSYKLKRGKYPNEVFLHGKTAFDEKEWEGFAEANRPGTQMVGVKIRRTNDIRLFTLRTHPVLRGIAAIIDGKRAYLWTSGFVPRLQTYPGMEVPVPLSVDISKGAGDITSVLRDVLALTKLNYNACVFADGVPVTLRFADAVGEILTAGPLEGIAPLPFKYYI